VSDLQQQLAEAQVELDREPEEPLQLLETAIPLPDDDQPTEAPKRRRYQRKSRDTAEDATRSSEGTASPPKRPRYVPRAQRPDKVLEREQESIEAMLTVMFVMSGTPLSFILPVTGTTMQMRAEQGAHALIEAGKANPRIAAIILTMVKGGHYGPLVMFGMTMLTAVAVDVGVVPPTSMPAQMMIKDVIEKFGVVPAAPSNGHAEQASGEQT
jgi:hypothetical protein